jgi:hypothetical protein
LCDESFTRAVRLKERKEAFADADRGVEASILLYEYEYEL